MNRFLPEDRLKRVRLSDRKPLAFFANEHHVTENLNIKETTLFTVFKVNGPKKTFFVTERGGSCSFFCYCRPGNNAIKFCVSNYKCAGCR